MKIPVNAFLLFAISVSSFGQSQLHWLPANSWDTNSTHQIVWRATPAVGYELFSSTNLLDWLTVPGYPVYASQSALAAGLDLTSGPNTRFFKLAEYDEQPPAIVERIPDDGDFAISQTNSIRVLFRDVSGVDPSSISITISNLGTYVVGDTSIVYTNNLLTFNPDGELLLGSKGSLIWIELTVADVNGYSAPYLWSFRLEQEPIENADVIVLGSPAAQSAGQELTTEQTTTFSLIYSDSGHAPKALTADSYSLIEVGTNYLLFSYSGAAPKFNEGDFIANGTPGYLHEIFYRTVVSSSKDSGILTVITEDASMTEIMQQVSFSSFSADGEAYSVAPDGQLIPAGGTAMAMDSMTLAESSVSISIGDSFSKSMDFSGTPITCTLDGEWEFVPTVSLAFDITDAQLRDFYLRIDGSSSIRVAPEISASGEYSRTVSTASPILSAGTVYFVGFAGPVPIWLDMDFELNAEVGVEVTAEATLSTAIERNDSFYIEAIYNVTNRSRNGWSRSPVQTSLSTDPFDCLIEGHGKAWAKLIPQVDLKLNSLFGAYANLSPELGLEGDGSISNDVLVSASFLLYGKINANAGLAVTGIDSGSLPSIDPWTLVYYPWLFQIPETNDLAIIEQPEGADVQLEDSAALQCLAVAAANEPIDYQWYHDGTLLPGQTNRNIEIPNMSEYDDGEYQIVVSSGEERIDSEVALVSIEIPFEMVRIPGGVNAGVNPGAWGDEYYPSNYSVSASTLYWDTTEIAKAQWDKVYRWGITNGYELVIAEARDANHPVFAAWPSIVAWCNARSEMDGRTPCYMSGTNVVRFVDYDPSCNFDADGYRLPTRDEWEYAARGGRTSLRFPWGNIISHAYANYSGSAAPPALEQSFITPNYDPGPVDPPWDLSWGWHPLYYPRGSYLYTSPIKSFHPNAYGLYDVVGNLAEWCWDRAGDELPYFRYALGEASGWAPPWVGFKGYLIRPYDKYYYGFRCVSNTEPPPQE